MKRVALLLLIAASTAAARPKSDTVPTSALVPFLSVTHTDGDADVAVDASLFARINQKNLQALDLAPSESVVFAVGAQAVKFAPGQPAHLPYVTNGTYVVAFQRFDGTTYTSQTHFAAPTTIQIQGEQKDAKTDFTWTPSEGKLDAVTTSFPACVHKAGLVLTGETSAELPANYAAACSGVVLAKFATMYSIEGSAPVGLSTGLSATTITPLNFRLNDAPAAADLR